MSRRRAKSFDNSRERLTGRLAESANDPGLDLLWLFSNVELADLLGADAPVPKFEPVEAKHQLDELADNTTCPACGHSWHQAR